MDAHERLGQQAVDLAVPVHVAARGQPARHRRSPRRPPRGSPRPWPPPLWPRSSLPRPRGRSSGPGKGLPPPGQPAVGRRPALASTGPSWTTWLTMSMSSSRSSNLHTCPGRHPRRGLPGAGPLEHVAGLRQGVLLHAWPGQRGRASAGSAAWSSGLGPGTSPRSTSAIRSSRSRSPPGSREYARGGYRPAG